MRYQLDPFSPSGISKEAEKPSGYRPYFAGGPGKPSLLDSVNGKHGAVQITAGSNVTIDNTGKDIIQISASGGGGSGTVETIVAGNNIDVDATDPANPIVAVESLTAADITDLTASAAELNFVDGVTSAIQTQMNGKQYKTFLTVGSADADYITDGTADEVQIEQAMTAANAAGGGIVFVKAGTYNINGAINPLANVWLKGAGMFQTKLVATATLPGSVIADTSSFSDVAPLEGFIVSDLEIDGSNMPTTPYSIGRKGLDSKFWRRCIVQNLYVHDTPATGIGIDNLDQVLIDHCIVKDCGTAGESQGSNGIGIGTGGMTNESFIVTNCITEGIANSAYLCEELDSTTTNRHYIFSNNISYNDFKGFSNSGALDVIIADNQVYSAGDDAIRVIVFSSHTAARTTIIGNQIDGSASEGIYIDTGVTDCRVEGNVVRNGTIEGIVVRGSRNVIQNNHVHHNGKHGIFVGAASGGTAISNVQVQNNIVYNNAFVTANTDGIRIDAANAAISDVLVTGNRSFDDQGVKTQRYGIIVTGASAITRLTILGNDFNGNKTADILNNASSVTNLIYRDNAGQSTAQTYENDLIVPDEAYGSGWNGSMEVPTKNAVYDKIETLTGGGVSESLAIAYSVAL